MKKLLLLPMICSSITILAQQELTGLVLDAVTSKPIAGIRISVPETKLIAVSDHDGRFSLKVGESQSNSIPIIFSGSGYKTRDLITDLSQQQLLTVYLSPKLIDIEEVRLSTGYQKIPKERATGSFSSVSNELLQQQVTTNLMDRLPAITSGLSVSTGLTEKGQLMIRGLSTLQGPKTPLIVVDNFPYEGDLSRINPNMVESITVLKDAAASSIWGAKAANGVIVISTKGSKFNQPLSMEFTANTTLSSKPDLSYSRQISSSDFIDVEMQLFKNGYYNSDINSSNHPVLTPVVDLLNKEKKGLISHEQAMQQIDRLRSVDVRDQYRKYMYLPLENRQYAVNVSGGFPNFSWTSFIGFDDNTGNLGEKYQRLNTRFQNVWKPIDQLTLTTGVQFSNTDSKSGRSAYNSITMKGNWKIPYLEFADSAGHPLAVNADYDQNYKNSLAGQGLLDWNYYPLTDWQNNQSKNNSNEIIINAGANYKLLKGLDADVKYQYQSLNGQSSSIKDEESYSTRYLINSFAQRNSDGTIKFIIPKGGILDKGNTQAAINNVRGQLNYNAAFGKHQISAIAGGETRSTVTKYETNRYYGYNQHDLSSAVVDYTHDYPNFVTGDNNFIQKNSSLRETRLNFLSFYANAAYTFDKKYTVSGSLRRDASNLFGLKTNDQWNPFWSAGAAWNISNESFYKLRWLPALKLRGSVGYSGNVDPAMVAVTTIAYDPDVSMYTGEPTARIDQYFNPQLRWEMLRMINFGVDFETENHRISGSFEYYIKKGSNLFGRAPIDYTTGITTLLWNVAGISGNGIDVVLNTKNIDKAFKWNSIFNFSTNKDEVTDYYLPNTFASNFVPAAGNTAPISGIVGLPVYSVFAYKWAGLDPNTGEARGYLNGEISKDYTKIMASDKGIEDLQYFGSAVPTTFGSFINSLKYKQVSFDIGITYKLGYWFRRNSINYTSLISSRDGHSDFAKRWQKPGDEIITDIPAVSFTSNSARDAFYNGSAVLVEKGDHIRLQYINIGYQIKQETLRNSPLKNLHLYCSINNLGLLWKANKAGIDPDYNWGTYSLGPVTSYSLGLRAQF
ncbi:SusC/RagA family TonB-linked outer membrane protein [Kaistella sp.]|uniref:SusC/RagA family TonB-linked outer membrane protein n=1 Tax=Kaistella sp. TaxID=2782235 RepID=UPI003C3A9C90